MKKGDKRFKGFTIIEVSLVLAIGGLIFLMVFVALPALNRSQRDTRRRDDVIRFMDEVKKYQRNNRGTLPGSSQTGNVNVTWSEGLSGSETTWQGFYRDYLGAGFIDPDGTNYRLTVVNCGATANDAECTDSEIKNLSTASFPNNYHIIVVRQASCNGNQAVLSSNPRKIAALYRLEGASYYCNSN